MCRDDFKLKIQMLSTYRNLLMGLAAIGVFVMHFIVQGVLAFPSPLKKIETVLLLWGSSGVDVFCLLSGFGLFYSLEKNPKLSQYYKKRVVRVYIPFLLITIPGYLFFLKVSIKKCLIKWTTLYLWASGNDGTWFVSFIIVMYLLSPIIYKFYKSSSTKKLIVKHCIAVALMWILLWGGERAFPALIAQVGIALYRIPIFFTGMLLAALVKQNANFSISDWIIAVMAIITVLKSVLDIDTGTIDMLTMACRSFFFVYVECIILQLLSKSQTKIRFVLLNSIGKYSLEFYLIHILVINWVKNKSDVVAYLHGRFDICFVIAGVTYLLSLLVSKISVGVMHKLKLN